jgi:DNA-binding LytR/AlgR family response regulator
MLSYLSKPYPSIIEDGYRKSVIINITVALVVFFILYVFKPTLFFDMKVSYSFSDSLLFSGITFCVAYFYTNILTRVLPRTFDTKTWTVGKEILMMFVILLSISIVNFFVGQAMFYPNTSFDITAFLEVIIATFVIGVIPMIVVVAFYLYYNQKNIQEKATSINESIQPKLLQESKTYQLNGTGKYEQLQLQGNHLLFIESIGNYCDIYYWQDEQLTKTTFRATLLALNEELPMNQFLKTHRSFLVNLNKVTQVSGNAQGYQLTLKDYEDRTIPVSRSNIQKFDEYYR